MKTLIAIVRSLLGLVFFIIYLSLFVLFSIITLRYWSVQLAGPAMRFFGRTCLKVVGIKQHFVNDWPFDKEEARVVIVNHQSTVDVLLAASVCPNRAGAVGKKELIWIPLMNIAWWSLRMFRIDRSNRESAIRTIQYATKHTIKQKRSMMLAPEGTRSKTGELLPFKKGAFYIALEGKLPIYPVLFCGAAEVMPKHAYWAYPKPIWVKFLPPVSTEDWTLENMNEKIEQIHKDMNEQYLALRAEMNLPALPGQPASTEQTSPAS